LESRIEESKREKTSEEERGFAVGKRFSGNGESRVKGAAVLVLKRAEEAEWLHGGE